MRNDIVISGAKKDGGAAATEAANTLRSQQRAKVLMLVSEGEVGGLVNGLQSVFLDNVPVKNPDGTSNFADVKATWTYGTQGQPALDGFDAVANEVVVGQQVDHATGVVRTITDPNVDAVRITITVPQLTEQDPKSGSVGASSFVWAIEVQSQMNGYVRKYESTVSGKNTSPYARAVKLDLDGQAPWDIRVVRVSVDPPTTNIVNRFVWSSFTELQQVKLRYPNSALLGLEIGAHPFGRMPSVRLDWVGQLLPVPSNYNHLKRRYSGTWDGTFKMATTSNPAWLVHALVTHERYGLGDFVPVEFSNKWALYKIAQYCDEPVSNGRGGTEPRFSINCQIRDRQEAIIVLREVVASFRGLCFWGASGIEFAQDAPTDPTLIYTPANVVTGDFNYPDVSEKTRHSVFICMWADQSQFGAEVPEVLFDDELVARYGTREITMRGLGITSRSMAARVCRWARYAEAYENGLVMFTVGSDGQVVEPGRIFKIADPTQSGDQLGGRIHSATSTTVTLDRDVTLVAGETYTLSVLQPDFGDPSNLRLQTQQVVTEPGVVREITVALPFAAPPEVETVWLLESSAVVATTWRCLGVEEVEGANQYRVLGVRHDPRKFPYIEDGMALDTRPISRLTVRPKRPASVVASESAFVEGQSYRSRVTVSWPAPAAGLMYVVSWRVSNGPWTELPSTSSNTIDIDGVGAGVFVAEVRSVNMLGTRSPGTTSEPLVLRGAGRLAGTFRVVARGLRDTQGSAPAGLYGATGEQISSAQRGYTVDVIDRATRAVLSTTSFDLYGDPAQAALMAAHLGQIGSTRIVVVRTWDEPLANRLGGGLPDAMYRCGASRAVFGSPNFKYRSAYVLVAIGGCGEGNGFEAYNGTVDSDPSAWVDVGFMVTVDGQLLVTGTGTTPRSLQDYGYTGDVNATYGAVSSANLLSNSEFGGRSITPAAYVANGGCVVGFFGSELARFGAASSPWVPSFSDALVLNEVGRSNAPDNYIDVMLEGLATESRYLPVNAGQRVELSVWLQAHSCRARLVLSWINGAGVYLGASATDIVAPPYGPAASPTLDNSFARYTLIGDPPAGASQVQAVVRKQSTLAGEGNSYLFIYKPFLGYAGAEQVQASPYSPGQRLGSGIVSTEHLALGSVSTQLTGSSAGEIHATYADAAIAQAQLLTWVPSEDADVRVTFVCQAHRAGADGNGGTTQVALAVTGATVISGQPIIPGVGNQSFTTRYVLRVTKGVTVVLRAAPAVSTWMPCEIWASDFSVDALTLKR
jgi:hypothetical protein